jgi:DNA modification methylase
MLSTTGMKGLDPFCGSTEKAGRQVRLVKLDPKYVDVIVRRWQDWTGGAATLEGNGRTFEELSAERQLRAA